MTKINVTKRMADFHACIDGELGLWGCGKSVDEAIGSLVLNHPEMFDVNIRTPYKEYDRRKENA